MKIPVVILTLGLMILQSTTKGIQKENIESKITQVIEIVQPKLGHEYAKKISGYIIEASKKEKISPYIVASTAYVESEFNYKAQPQKGIMQITKSLGKSHKTLNYKNSKDNILIGAKYLKYLHLSSRGSLDRMWNRYSGNSSFYSRRCSKVYKIFKYNSIVNIKERLKKKELWR